MSEQRNESSAAYTPSVGDRIVMTGRNVPYEGERGVITNSPGKVFNGWTVKLDNGHIIGVDRKYLRAESLNADRTPSAVSGRGFPLIGPERKRGSVTSTATTPEPCIWPRCLGAGPPEAECSDGCAHAHDTPALCDISVLSGPAARGAEVGSTSAGGRVEGASDDARPRLLDVNELRRRPPATDSRAAGARCESCGGRAPCRYGDAPSTCLIFQLGPSS
jgi:hypothetical protein